MISIFSATVNFVAATASSLEKSTNFSVKKTVNAAFGFLRVNPFQNEPWFLPVCSISLLKTLREKEKLLIMSNFSFSHSVFYQFVENFCHFHQTLNFLQSVSDRRSLTFVVWERVKPFSYKQMILFTRLSEM